MSGFPNLPGRTLKINEMKEARKTDIWGTPVLAWLFVDLFRSFPERVLSSHQLFWFFRSIQQWLFGWLLSDSFRWLQLACLRPFPHNKWQFYVTVCAHQVLQALCSTALKKHKERGEMSSGNLHSPHLGSCPGVHPPLLSGM